MRLHCNVLLLNIGTEVNENCHLCVYVTYRKLN